MQLFLVPFLSTSREIPHLAFTPAWAGMVPGDATGHRPSLAVRWCQALLNETIQKRSVVSRLLANFGFEHLL